jgi:proteasome accessory factor A
LETFAADAKLEPDDPWLVSLDLAYHDLDPARGLFQGLDAEGTARVSDPDAVERAVRQAPADTRAAIRGLCVTRFADEVESIQWSLIATRSGEALDLGSVVEPQSVGVLLGLLQDAPSLSAAIRGWRDRMTLRGHA